MPIYTYRALVYSKKNPLGWEQSFVCQEPNRLKAQDLHEEHVKTKSPGVRVEDVYPDPEYPPILCHWKRRNAEVNKDGSENYVCLECGRKAVRYPNSKQVTGKVPKGCHKEIGK